MCPGTKSIQFDDFLLPWYTSQMIGDPNHILSYVSDEWMFIYHNFYHMKNKNTHQTCPFQVPEDEIFQLPVVAFSRFVPAVFADLFFLVPVLGWKSHDLWLDQMDTAGRKVPFMIFFMMGLNKTSRFVKVQKNIPTPKSCRSGAEWESWIELAISCAGSWHIHPWCLHSWCPSTLCLSAQCSWSSSCPKRVFRSSGWDLALLPR